MTPQHTAFFDHPPEQVWPMLSQLHTEACCDLPIGPTAQEGIAVDHLHKAASEKQITPVRGLKRGEKHRRDFSYCTR